MFGKSGKCKCTKFTFLSPGLTSVCNFVNFTHLSEYPSHSIHHLEHNSWLYSVTGLWEKKLIFFSFSNWSPSNVENQSKPAVVEDCNHNLCAFYPILWSATCLNWMLKNIVGVNFTFKSDRIFCGSHNSVMSAPG